jgi:uncharacterized protein (TIGR02266 family)
MDSSAGPPSRRYPVDLDVRLGDEDGSYSGVAENLSRGGVFVATHVAKPVGARIDLAIHLPGVPQPVRVLGEVRWVRACMPDGELPPGLGFQFVKFALGAAYAIDRYLARQELAAGDTSITDHYEADALPARAGR